MTKQKAPPKRGGARPGAGRKKRDTELVGWRLRSSTVAAVKAAAIRAGIKPGQFVDQILEARLRAGGF
jgi:hypothetical protein